MQTFIDTQLYQQQMHYNIHRKHKIKTTNITLKQYYHT